MTKPIFDQMVNEASEWFRSQGIPAVNGYTTEGTPAMTNVIAEIHDAVADGLSNIKGWAAELEAKLPAIEQRAARFAASPIVKALETVTLPPQVEHDIAVLITHYGAVNNTPPATPDSVPAPTTVLSETLSATQNTAVQ